MEPRERPTREQREQRKNRGREVKEGSERERERERERADNEQRWSRKGVRGVVLGASELHFGAPRTCFGTFWH